MSHCDTCGRPMTEADPFVVCSQCLFASALAPIPGAGGGMAPSADDASGRAGADAMLGRLSGPEAFADRYEIQERMWVGGQGEILRVWDLRLRRSVAMKRLGGVGAPRDAGVARFLAEVQIAAQLQHPGILPVHDVGLDPDGRPFYTTDLLPGTTFADVIQKVRRAIRPGPALHDALGKLVRVCEILGHAHSRGVIHRDLKPENILVGAFEDVRVIDWGSAHVAAAPERGGVGAGRLASGRVRTDREDALSLDADSLLTTARSGPPITVLFTPPESLREVPPAPSPAVDVYAVGVMLYEVCAGRKPYSDRDGTLPATDELTRRILEGGPEPVRRANRRVARDLEAICRKAMARDPTVRYGGMSELAADLRAFREVRRVTARTGGAFAATRQRLRRHPVVASEAPVPPSSKP